MSVKREIRLNRQITTNVLLGILLPFLLMFILEHFGNFTIERIEIITEIIDSVTGEVVNQEDENMERIDFIYFESFFGDIIKKNVYKDNLYVHVNSNDRLYNQLSYFERLPYYFKAIKADIYYPLTLSILILLYIIFRRNFKISFTD